MRNGYSFGTTINSMTPFAHLHTRSWFSFRAGGSAPEALVAQAAAVGVTHLALTDVNGVYGIVRFQRACAAHGIHGIVGSTLYIHQPSEPPKRRRRSSQRDHPPEPDTLYPILLLAQDQAGYARLSTWITQAHLACREAPHLPLSTLEGVGGLHLVICEAFRWDVSVLSSLKATWGDALSLELTHHYGVSDQRHMRAIFRVHQATDIPLLATGNVRYATARDYRRYDLLTCVRLGIDVFIPNRGGLCTGARPIRKRICRHHIAGARGVFPRGTRNHCRSRAARHPMCRQGQCRQRDRVLPPWDYSRRPARPQPAF
ncbi:MAG: PHP domain-containing protein [Bacteroidetes bacterium]|nr:PHP domain-containing protein [Bacteroidota bacterium]